MNYKYKFLEEADVTRLRELSENGESELLVKFGFECINAYQTGENTGLKITSGAFAVTAIASCYVLYKVSKSKKSKESE